MKPLLILAKNKDTYFIKRLINEVGVSHCMLFDPWSNEHVPEATQQCLVRTTGVYGSDADLDFLKGYPGNIINPLSALELFRRKSTQYQFFSDHNLPALPWLELIDLSWDEVHHWVRLCRQSQFIVKPDRGQGGWGIEIHDLPSLKDWFELQKQRQDLNYLLQPFLTEAHEYRVFFVGEELTTLRREATTNHMAANFRQGGLAHLDELPAWSVANIKRLIQDSGAQYGAIDVFLRHPEMWILELNTAPGVEQLEQVSGQNIVADIATKLLGFR